MHLRDRRLDPGWSDTRYAVRAPLARWLRAKAHEASAHAGCRVLDVGCGDRRYEPLFVAAGAIYVGCDAEWNPDADVHGYADALPVDDASFDIVICTQVLEHLPDAAAAVRELRRVIRKGGIALASTHGTAVYHPNPVDLSRWTYAGLERLFDENGDWSAVLVRPAQGTAATLAMLNGQFAQLLCKRLRVQLMARPVVAALNWSGAALDRAIPILREPVPGSLNATFHLEAIA